MALTHVRRLDPYLGFRFVVEIEGLIVAGFTDVSGLSAEVTPFVYKEGGVNEYEHQLPGPATWPRLVLKRGLTDVDDLWRWHEDVRRGRVVRRNGSVIIGAEPGSGGLGIYRWDFTGAYPVKWVGPELRAASATVAVESVELVHRGLVKGSAG
jgi:phage tail-like protein